MWNATPSTFASTSGFWATHACGVLGVALLIWVFQTLVVGAVPSVPPMTIKPSETAAADRPASGTGSFAASTVVHLPSVPSLAIVMA